MSKTVVVRYKAHPSATDENQRLVERVFAQLAQENPGGLRYAVFRLADGVTFMHVAVIGSDDNPLATLSAFGEYVSGIADRCVEQPSSTDATLVGSYRFLTS